MRPLVQFPGRGAITASRTWSVDEAARPVSRPRRHHRTHFEQVDQRHSGKERRRTRAAPAVRSARAPDTAPARSPDRHRGRSADSFGSLPRCSMAAASRASSRWRCACITRLVFVGDRLRQRFDVRQHGRACSSSSPVILNFSRPRSTMLKRPSGSGSECVMTPAQPIGYTGGRPCVVGLESGLQQHHADDAIARQRVFDHRAIPRLEDVQRQKHVGEEHNVRKREDRDRGW